MPEDDVEFLTPLEDLRVSQGRSNRMGWRGPRGESFRYHGPLFDLGFGIEGRRADRGWRGLLWHLTYGYVNGFPFTHVVHYAVMHAFFPKAVKRGVERFRHQAATDTVVLRHWSPRRNDKEQAA